MKILQEFQEFALKGNAIDLAIGVVIGAAFNKIVGSLVNDIITPPLGILMGGVNFAELRIVLKDVVCDDAGRLIQDAVTINIGNFMQVLIDFILVAFSLFIVIKGMNVLRERGTTLLPTVRKRSPKKPAKK